MLSRIAEREAETDRINPRFQIDQWKCVIHLFYVDNQRVMTLSRFTRCKLHDALNVSPNDTTRPEVA